MYVFSKGRFDFFKKISNCISRNITAFEFLYLMLKFMDLVIYLIWVNTITYVTLSLVGIMIEMTIIKFFPKISIVQLIVQMIT